MLDILVYQGKSIHRLTISAYGWLNILSLCFVFYNQTIEISFVFSIDKTYHISHHKPVQLSAYIDSFRFYHFRDDQPVLMQPGGYFELIFQLDCNFQQTTPDGSGWQERPAHFIGGLHNRAHMVKPLKIGAQLISVKFKPHCARYFIPDRLNLFKNRIVNLQDILPGTSIQRLEEIHSAKRISDKLERIENFLITVFKQRTDSRIDHVLFEIYRRQGFVSVEDLTGKAFLSRSQLRKRFSEEIGMSPKEYSKIVRINSVIGLLEREPGVKLTELTYRLGYFDQAHFIKDFKSVTGFSPKSFITSSQ